MKHLKQGNKVIADEYEKVGQELKNKLTEAEKEVRINLIEIWFSDKHLKNQEPKIEFCHEYDLEILVLLLMKKLENFAYHL